MSDALELAREVVANDARDTWSLASLTLARAVIAQAEELAKLREQMAASVELREAISIAEALDENERIREVVTQLVTKLEKGATISAGFCSWCRERWLHPDNATPDDVRELSRVHAYRCKLSPLKLERDALLADVAQLRAALREALDAIDGGREPIALPDARIAELRRLVTP